MRVASTTDPVILIRVRRITMIAAALALALTGCGSSTRQATAPASLGTAHHAVSSGPALRAHPQAIQPVAGAVPSSAGAVPSSAGAVPSSAGGGSVSVGVSGSAAKPASDAQVRAELAASNISPDPDRATLTSNLLAVAPIAAPAQVQAVINAGNQIAHLPYLWGGGHARYEDTAYDCSGSISFVLAAAGLLSGTMTSGQLMHWGAPGPGKWITVYASQGHTFMYIAGLRFDTVALAQQGSRWSNRSGGASDGGGFVARHPPGL
jgi:cell wall-associated NlpC family hydrolase